jgi:hypothetical protein
VNLTETIPPAWADLETALRHRHPVQIGYHGRSRIVCPHALGWKNHRPMLLGYQIGGHTTSGTLHPDPTKRWRCMYIDEIDHVAADTTAGWQTTRNYNPQRPFPAIDHVILAV